MEYQDLECVLHSALFIMIRYQPTNNELPNTFLPSSWELISIVLDSYESMILKAMKRYQPTSALHHHLLLLLLLLHHHHHIVYAVPSSSANLSTTWINSVGHNYSFQWFDVPSNTSVYAILPPIPLNNTVDLLLACGFHCLVNRRNCLLSVLVLAHPSQVLWSANRGKAVDENATLQLTAQGDLLLRDADGSLTWSTNTAGKGVVGMKLTARGNHMLFDANNTTVWQSFDHPTDTLVSGQRLLKGQRLTTNVMETFRIPMFFISSSSNWFGAFIGLNDPQLYFNISAHPSLFPNVTGEALTFFADPSSSSHPDGVTFQFLKLIADGHIRFYECVKSSCEVGVDRMGENLSKCEYPMVCGRYGICTRQEQCRCPRAENSTTFFTPLSYTQPNYGCSAVAALSCQSPEQHRLLPLPGVGYFASDVTAPTYRVTTEESCKEACLANCSCQAALFRSSSNGSCFLLQDVYSLTDNRYEFNAYIKVQVPPSSPPPLPPPSKDGTSWIAGAVVGAIAAAVLVAAIAVVWYRKARASREGNKEEEEDEEDFPQLAGMPTRFSYEDMRSATGNFERKLGGGGFGSVFDGTLVDGTRVAIKRLETVSQGKKAFLAEVETIGSIHHLNLVRLVGFCAEKLHRLLVYEYMSNGSLDRWIFHKEENGELGWQILRKIIHQVAKGLSYLHEGCRQKIAHLDIKPENILLDSSFDAKVSDFGLAKLIDRDQSAVVTMVRGTPGYLAPEWLTSMITEKVDVYSFGVVVMEMVCGRRNMDFSRPEGSIHLLALVKEKAIAGKLLDAIDERKRDVQRDGRDLEEMLRLAIWCVQYDPSKRPAMSTVVKVLEGVEEVTPDLDYNFSILVPNLAHDVGKPSSGSTPMLPSILSGPR